MNTLVDEYRRQFPNDQRSDEDITLLLAAQDDGSFSQYPDFAADVKRITALRSTSAELNKPNYAQEFSRALSRGVGSLKESAYGAAALGADVVGLDGVRDAAIEKYIESRDESVGENAPTVGRVEDVKNLDTAARFGLGKLGELVPQVAESLVVGAAGAIAGSAVAPGPGTAAGAAAGLTEGFVARQSAKAIIKAGVDKLIGNLSIDTAAKQIIKDQLERVATKQSIEGALHPVAQKLIASQIKSSAAKMGSLGANIVNFYGIGAGTIYGDLATREGVDRKDARDAALVGGIGSALANAPLPAVIISRYFPGVGHTVAKKYLERLAKDAAIEIPLGATGETLDELVQIASEKYADPKRRDTGLDDQDLSRLLNAAVVGGGAGTVASPISAIPGGSDANPDPKPSAFSADLSKRYFRDVSLERQKQIQTLATREESGALDSTDITNIRNLTPQEQNYFTAFKALPIEEKNKETARVVTNKEVVTDGSEEEEQGQGKQVLTSPAAPAVANPLTAAVAPESAKIPISDQQVKDLVALKYTQNEIDTMDAAEAQAIIEAKQENPKLNRKKRFQKALTSTKTAVATAEVKLAQEKARAETKPNPTTEEIDKDKYPKGRLDYAGVKVKIETGKGEIRQNKSGSVPWHVKMEHDYGDMDGTIGADGDPKDVTLGDNPESTRYFVIDQIDPESGEFDEHKSFVGFLETEDALNAYKKSFSDGSGKKRMGGITEMSKEAFDKWRFDDGIATKPLRYKKSKDLAESKPAKTAPASKLTAATTPATPVVAAASTHEEKLAHKRKIDEEHGKLVIQERDDIEFFGKDSDEAKASSAKLRQFELDNAAWVGAARSAMAEKGDTSNLPNVPKAVAAASPNSYVSSSRNRDEFLNGVIAASKSIPDGSVINDPETGESWTIKKITRSTGTHVVEFEAKSSGASSFSVETKLGDKPKVIGSPDGGAFSKEAVVEPAANPVTRSAATIETSTAPTTEQTADDTIAREVENETGFKLVKKAQAGAMAIPTPEQMASYSPEDRAKVEQMLKMFPAEWEFTDNRDGSKTPGRTFRAPITATKAEMLDSYRKSAPEYITPESIGLTKQKGKLGKQGFYKSAVTGMDASVQIEGDTIYLVNLRAIEQSKGTGGAFIEKLKQLSDATNRKIKLTAKADVDGDLQAKLEKFYQAHGFNPVDGFAKDQSYLGRNYEYIKGAPEYKAKENSGRASGTIDGVTRTISAKDIDVENRGTFGSSKRGKKDGPTIVQPAFFRTSGITARAALFIKLLSDKGTPSGVKTKVVSGVKVANPDYAPGKKQLTKRLTVLHDKQTGKVHIVSTHETGGAPAITIFDESLRPKGRGNKTGDKTIALAKILDVKQPDGTPRFEPVASMRTAQLTEYFHQEIPTLEQFENEFGKPLQTATDNMGVRATLIAEQLEDLKQEKSGKPGKKKGEAKTDIVTEHLTEENIQQRLKPKLERELGEPGHVDLDDDEVRTLILGLANANIQSYTDFSAKRASGLIDEKTMAVMTKALAQDSEFIHRIIEDGIIQALIDYDKANNGRTNYAGLIGSAQSGAAATTPGRLPDTQGRSGQGAGGPAPAVASTTDSAGQPQPAGNAGNKVADKADRKIKRLEDFTEKDLFNNTIFRLENGERIVALGQELEASLDDWIAFKFGTSKEGESAKNRIVSDIKKNGAQSYLFRKSWFEVFRRIDNASKPSLSTREAGDSMASGIFKSQKAGNAVADPTTGTVAKPTNVGDAIQQALDKKAAEESIIDPTSIRPLPKPTDGDPRGIGPINEDLESNPTGWDSVETDAESEPIDPEHERILDAIYQNAAAAGLDVRLIQSDRTHGLYSRDRKLVTHWVGRAIGATDLNVAIHELAHHVSLQMPMNIRRQVIGAIMRVTDGKLGIELHPDTRIQSSNPDKLSPAVLQEERLVGATELSLHRSGFNPRDANTYAQAFVRALKDIVYQAILKFQSMFNMETSEDLARKYFENSVKRLLAGDLSRYSYLDMLGLAKASPSTRYDKWFKTSSATGERMTADGLAYDHQDNTSPEGIQFNIDTALHSMPVTENPKATRTVRVEREVAALNHLIELQDMAAAALEAADGSDKILKGKTAMEWLRKMLKLPDPQAAKEDLNGRLDFDQQPVQFNPDKKVVDFKDASNKDAVLDKMYRDTQAMSHKLSQAVLALTTKLKELAEYKTSTIERISKSRERYADLDEQARVLRIKVDKELRTMSDYVDGFSKRSAIATQLRVLDQNNHPKTYNRAIAKLIADKTITGPRLVEVLDIASNIPTIDFKAKADEIRKAMRESGKFNALTTDSPVNRAMLAAVIAVAKSNPKMLAELELRRLKDGRSEIESELDAMISGGARPKLKKTLTRADSIRDRILSEYAKEAKRIKDATDAEAEANIDLKALQRVAPVVETSLDKLTGELGVTQDFVFKDGAEYLAVTEDMNEDDILKSKTKLKLDTSDSPTDPKKLEDQAADMKRFLMKREERYAAGDLTAKNRWYQRVERQYSEMATRLHYNLEGLPSARSGFELNLMPEFSAIGDAFGTPAAQLVRRLGNYFAKTEAFLRNVSDGIYDKDARMRRELTRLLPGLNDDNLQTFIDAAKFDIEDNMADLVEAYADRPDKLKRIIYNRVRDNILATKLAKDIKLASVIERFMPTFEKLLDHEWEAGEQHYKGTVIKGLEAHNPITGNAEATGLKVKDPNIKITNDEGEQVVGQRRHVAKGWRTFGGRRMSNGFSQMIGALRRSDWASFSKVVGGGKLKDAYKEDPEAASAILQKFFNNAKDGELVRNWFLRMLASRKQESSFDAPALEDEVTTPPADPEIVRRAYEAAPEGDVLQFIENLYDMHDGVSDRATYVQHVADQLIEHWDDVNAIAEKYFPDDGKHNPMNSIAGMSPGALIDAREISGLPSEWFSFYKFDKPSLHKLSRLISAEVAFGRGSATLAGLMDTVTSEVNAAITKLNAERARVRETNPTWSDSKIEKTVEKMEDYKRLKQFEDRAQLIPNSIKGLSTFFRKDNSIEANLAAGIRLTQLTSRMMVNNPSSAIYQLAALFDPMFRFGVSGSTVKATAAGIKAHLHESVASLAQAIGIQMQNSEHNQRFNDLNLQYPERIKKWGDEFTRWENESAVSHVARVAEEALAFPIGKGESKQHVQFRPTALFDWTTMIADRALDAGMSNLVGNFMARGVEFYRAHPELANDSGYQLSDKDLGLSMGDSGTLKQLKIDMQNFGLNYDQMVKNTIKRGDGKIFTDQEALSLNAMAMFLVSSQSNIATMKSSAWNNSVVRAAVPLLGWMGRRTLDFAGKRLDENGQLQVKALMRGLAGVAAVSVGGLALSAIVDKYYEELIGKKRNLRPMNSALGLTEHIARIGSTGFFGELANGALSVGQGGDSRIISADRRIVALSALMTVQKAASSMLNQGEIDYSRVGRPIFSAIGGGGILQYMGIFNKLTGADNVESRVNARINAQNYLRVIGRELNLSVRQPSGSSGTPTPITPHITRMELAAYANNAADFRSAYVEAIEQAKDEGFEDPVDHVKRSFAAKNPLRTVFQASPSTKEYERILIALPQDGREAVSSAVDNFNRYAESIGARAFEGKAEKSKVGTLSDRKAMFGSAMTSRANQAAPRWQAR